MSEKYAGPVKIAGVDLVCRHCGYRAFWEYHVAVEDIRGWFREGLVGTAYACARCGCVHWFANPPPSTECLKCGGRVSIYHYDDTCPICGASYQAPGVNPKGVPPQERPT